MVRYCGDGSQRLGGLSVCLDAAGRIGINAGKVLVVTLAGLERAVLGVVRGVEGAPDTVVNVLTKVTGVGARRVADLETEEVSAKEAKRGGG